MEKQTLPNSNLILVFGILAILGCCCYGIFGIVFAIIALLMARKATEMYKTNPELYTGYQNVKTGKILAIIGLVLSLLALIGTIVSIIVYGGLEGLEEMQRELMREYEG